MPADVVEGVPVPLGAVLGDVGSNPIDLKSVEELPKGDLVRIDCGAGLRLGDQAGALDLRLPLVAGEAVPAAFALAGLRIAHVNDDGPMTGRAFADMALHFFSPSSSDFWWARC